MDMIASIFGGRWTVEDCTCSTATTGFPQERLRIFPWLRHRRLGEPVVHRHIPWSTFEKKFQRQCNVTWHAFFEVHKEDADGDGILKDELAWAADRREALCKRARLSSLAQQALDEARVVYNLDSKWVCALNAGELKFLTRYLDKFNEGRHNARRPLGDLPQDGAGFVCVLNQDPEHRSTHNMGRHTLPTITRRTHFVFSVVHQRWLAPYELLLSQGWPVLGSFAQPGETCCWMRPRASYGLPKRKRHKITEQVGNAMHMPLAGCALLWWVCCNGASGTDSNIRGGSRLLALCGGDRSQEEDLQQAGRAAKRSKLA